jgi:hypothetical protein
LESTDFKKVDFTENQDVIEYAPTLPGAYTFHYEVFDLCDSRKQPVTVNARCPPKPTAKIKTNLDARLIVTQGGKAELDASDSQANFPDGKIVSYQFFVMAAPADSPLKNSECDATGKTPCKAVSTDGQYSTEGLQISGEYKIKLVVTDGCSMDETIVCFRVECGCGPTANAGATSTVWTNTPNGFNNGATSSGNNDAAINSPSYMLDGSLSYDFDTKSGLTYEWDFIEWQQVAAGGQNTIWTPSTDTTSGGRGGTRLKTNCATSKAGTSFTKECSFDSIPSAVGDQVNEGALTSKDNSPAATAAVSPAGFPKKCPAYVDNEYDFSVPTTQMKADITRSVQTVQNKTCFNQRKTTVKATAATATSLCKIRIQQTADGVADARNNARARLTVSSLKGCRGLWTYRLTVKDGCGSATMSTDEIKVTVRCNEPPVAIACCNNTQMWDTQIQAFQEVRIDGRSSNDPDNGINGALTYTWSFVNSPTGFCPYVHKPCVESYCTNPNGFTDVQPTAGTPNFNMNFRGSSGVTCGPTVFPNVKDRTQTVDPVCQPPSTNPLPAGAKQCQYRNIRPTGYHVGNSAYFFPGTKGEYLVQLTVSDGCSESTDRIHIFAECPLLSVSAQVLGSNGQAPSFNLVKPGSGPISVDLQGSFQYAADAGLLDYSWSSTRQGRANQAAGTATFSAGNAAKTTVSFNAAGSYVITFQVTDSCQTMSAVLPAITVSCNPAPSLVQIARTSAGGRGDVRVVEYSGTGFPPVLLSVSAQDQDALTYSFSLTQAASNVASNQRSPTEFEFTPVANNSGTVSYTVTATASDGCSTSPPASYTIQAQCKTGLASRPVITGRTTSVIDYEPSAPNPNFFPQISFESQSTWPTYTDAGAQKIFSWSVERSTSTRQSQGTGSAVTFQGQGTATISLRPETSGQYTVSLTVLDGCSSSTQTTPFTAQCATASIAIVTSKSGTSVNWNSFKTTASGAFNAVTLDGQTSTGYAGQELRYNWGVAAANSVKVALTSTSGSTTSFTPTTGGNYGFTLTVRNGPCPESAPASFQVSANCNELSATLRQGSGGNSAAVVMSSIWDGTKFGTIELDGTALVYRETASRAASAQSGNLRSLRYTWTVEQSPACSCYMQDKGSTDVASTEVTSDKITTKIPSANASVVIEDTNYCTEKTTTTTITKTVLANHHYTLPHTCFKPDCPGTYRIKLNVADGCTESNAEATITAACAAAPSVTIESPGVQTLEGNKFKRVDLRANVIFPSTETLTYQWTLDTVPEGSALKSGGYLSITNAQMPTASIVPDRAGSYQFSFKVMDGCNEPQSATMTMTVQCNSNLQIQSAQPSPATLNVDWVNTLVNFNNQKFELRGAVDKTNCNVMKSRWSLVTRGCSEPYPPGATKPPVPVTSGCPRCASQCNWTVAETPCTDVAVNPGYLNPELKEKKDCGATFKPRFPGTYTLQFTVSDCCGRSMSTMRVVAKCATGIRANVDAKEIDMALQCSEWQARTLRGTIETLREAGPPTSTQACPVKAAPRCTDAVKTKCCPKTTSKCCNYQCPQCSQCPQCPQCPGYTAATAGAAEEYKLPYNTAFAQGASSSENPFALKASLLTGIVAPLGALVMFSLIGNVVLLTLYRNRNTAKEILP